MKRITGILLMICMLFGTGAWAESRITEEQRNLWLSDDQYYYRQLSAEHKAAWEQDIYNALNYPDQVKAENWDMRMQALASMIVTDNPRIFWIDWIDSQGMLRYETGTVATYAPLEFPDGKSLKDLQEIFLRAIDGDVSEISGALPAKAGIREKAKAIHDWVCKNNSYN